MIITDRERGYTSSRRVIRRPRPLTRNLVPLESSSPNSSLGTISKSVVIVMDAMKDFSYEPLQWALNNVIAPGYTVTLLGIMPWLNLPLACKTCLDVWTLDLEEVKERSDWKSDVKYQKLHAIVELCEKYGVDLDMKVVMGYPMQLRVIEQTTRLHATWVIFDRHHRKHRRFYSKKIPSNIVMMTSHGEVDILKVQPMMCSTASTPAESPATQLPPIIPKVIISEKLMEMLRQKEQESHQPIC